MRNSIILFLLATTHLIGIVSYAESNILISIDTLSILFVILVAAGFLAKAIEDTKG